MTSAQKAEVNALEKKIQPQIPFYITVINKESVTGGLLVCFKFVLCTHYSAGETFVE